MEKQGDWWTPTENFVAPPLPNPPRSCDEKDATTPVN